MFSKLYRIFSEKIQIFKMAYNSSMYEMAQKVQLTLFPPMFPDLVTADGVGCK